MAPQGGRWQRRIQAAESAGRLLDELSVDQIQQIDVFGICEDLGLWLAFLPLDNLLGAFVPEGVGGVLVTTQRPIPIQRYTAAHELGHWRLDHGHGLALDGEEHVLGATPVEREQLAQVFAGSLLMPPPLVFGVLDRLGLGGRAVEPEHAYAVAREAGVSYEAAVRQLTHLEVISNGQAALLRRRRPLQVKADLALGRRPVNGYADVWPVNEDWHDQVLSLRVEDEVVISLPENRTTGYRWMFSDEHRHVETSPAPQPLTGEPSAAADPGVVATLRAQFAATSPTGEAARAPGVVLERLRRVTATRSRQLPSAEGAEVVGDEYVPARTRWLPPRDARNHRLAQHSSSGAGNATPSSSGSDRRVVAATGRRLLGVRFARPGPATVHLHYRSRYNNDDPIEEYVLHALVEPRHIGFSVDQITTDVDEPWTAQVRQRRLERPLDSLDDDEEFDVESETEDSV
ncbi:MAG: ImmA/IrrE family metallo-endopeptidase [Actinobacteria bacterium]|nr:ImmA/IrrE family metallo-endopeptidase [Actinomycetota bacterium]